MLTSSELSDLRVLLKQSLVNSSGKDLFTSLYNSWCHSPMATISLCLLAQERFLLLLTIILFLFKNVSWPSCKQAYQHACAVIQSLGEEDINLKFLIQLDKLVRLLETPIFAFLRLQVCHACLLCSHNFMGVRNAKLVAFAVDLSRNLIDPPSGFIGITREKRDGERETLKNNPYPKPCT